MYDDFSIRLTGKPPDGKRNDDAKSQIQISIGRARGQVMIEFGVPGKSEWAAFPPETARAIAASLINHANAIDGRGPVIKHVKK